MSESQTEARFFEAIHGNPRLAFLAREARPGNSLPGLFWLSGFASDMRGSKACFVDDLAQRQGRAALRFDYSGHGESDGLFEDGTIGQWAAQALDMFRALTTGPQIVIGSSMGGWIALLMARALARLGEAQRLAGMVLIAPAVDFTEELAWPRLPEAARREIESTGLWRRPAGPDGFTFPFTRRLFEDGRENLLFGGAIRSHCPVAILQGMQDPDVPWPHAMKLVEHLAGDPVTLTLIKDGEHRLSRPGDLAALDKAIAFLDQVNLT
jgi:pimeloyl-ACP methyl ester carboxylesterase